MGTYRRWMATVAAVLTLGGIVGCIQVRQEVDLCPDGSGRMYVRTSGELPKIFQEPGGSDQSLYEQVGTRSNGFVAYTDAKFTQHGDRRTTEFVGWFDDLNDVRFGPDEGESQGGDGEGFELGFAWKPAGDLYVLEVDAGIVRELADQAIEFDQRAKELDDIVREAPPERREQAEAMAETSRKMFESVWKSTIAKFEFELVIRLPGRIREVSGFEKVDARTVRIHVDEEQMSDLARMRELQAAEFSVQCDDSVLSELDLKAFAKRLEEAKAEWAENPASRTVSVDQVASVGEEDVYGETELLPGGNRLLVIDRARPDGPFALLNSGGKELGKLSIEALGGRDVFTSPDATLLHVLTQDAHEIVTFRLPSGEHVWTLHEPPDAEEVYWWMAVATDGNVYVDKGPRGIHLHDGKTGRHLRAVTRGESMALITAVHDPAHIVVREEGVFRVLDTKVGEQLWHQPATVEGKVQIGEEWVSAWDAWPIHGGRLLLASAVRSGTELTAHEAKTGKLAWRRRVRSPDVYQHPAHRHALVTSSAPGYRLLDLSNGEDLGRVTGVAGGTTAVGVDATGGFWFQTKFMMQHARKYRLRLK